MNNVIDEYIHNELPLYLLDIGYMKLLNRGAVKNSLQDDINDFIEENLRSKIHLADIPDTSKDWITEKTAYAIFSHRWLSTGELTFDLVRKFEKLGPEGFQQLQLNEDDVWSSARILRAAGKFPTNKRQQEFELLDAMIEFCGNLSDDQRDGCPDLVKLIKFCDIARQHGCNFVWFDTGCIDKSSSAELEESIRSMFNWYRRSDICIVHLADTTDLLSMKRDPWFTRGWTLQELLAPERIKFFGGSWRPIMPARSKSNDNDKVDDDILDVPFWEIVSEITGISTSHLLNFSPGIQYARDALVWASKRRTTRTEDIAYCLIGLLNIPFSIAYGEGHMAFYRLQVEILQRSPDMGLFAWTGQPSIHNSMLAARVDAFSTLPFDYDPDESQDNGSDEIAHMLTNRGLRISLPVYDVRKVPISQDGKGVRLHAEGLGKVVVDSPDLEEYERLRIAILTGVSDGETMLAICLGYVKGRWTRVQTSQHIELSFSRKARDPSTLHIK